MSWLPPSQKETASPLRLFCLPHAGAGAAGYRPWVSPLQPGIQVLAVQLPGRENRFHEKLFTSTVDMVPALVAGLRPYLDRAYAIFGHSMGGLLAFEFAREVRRLGLREPQHLFISSHRAPHIAETAPPMHRLGDADFRTALRDLQGTPEEVLANEELMQLAEPILRADFQLCETYRYEPEPPLDVPLSIFGGTDDSHVRQADLEAWKEHTTRQMRLRMMPGHHLYLREQRDALLEAIRSDLRPQPH
jgi:medium-chain acyl-[acyl-carrier-protein] hydrolase